MSGLAVGSPAYDNESIAWKLKTADLVTVTIAFLLVIGRLYTKYAITRSPGWEDCEISPSHISVPLKLNFAWNRHFGPGIAYCNRPCSRGFYWYVFID